MLLENGPSIKYPNGGETIYQRKIDIEWYEPRIIKESLDVLWYEIFFTDSYEKFKDNKWKQISKISTGNTNFTWHIPFNIKSDDCYLGIRLCNHSGERSKMSVSSSFRIRERQLSVPSVFKPIPQSSYFIYVPIVLDISAIIEQCSERAYYNIYYKCDSLDIDWKFIKKHVPITTPPVYWDVRDITSADDYMIKVELVDGDVVSTPVVIDKIKINSLNYFLTDTLPPIGFLDIINNEEFINYRNIITSLVAYDETTGVESVRIEQMDINDDFAISKSPYYDMTDLISYEVKGDDGEKLIQARYRDYAGNVVIPDPEKENFRKYKELNNRPIDFILPIEGAEDYENLWIAFGGKNPSLYKNLSYKVDLPNNVISMEILYGDDLYLSLKHNKKKGVLKRYNEDGLNDVLEIDEKDSQINSMTVFDNKIFMGLQNGNIVSFDGSYNIEYNNMLWSKSVAYIKSFKNLLFVFFNNDTNVYIFSGKDGDYELKIIDMNIGGL